MSEECVGHAVKVCPFFIDKTNEVVKMTITPSELNDICSNIVASAETYNNETHAYFYTAFRTGARANEITELTERIVYIDATNVVYTTEKTNGERAVLKTDVAELFRRRYEQNIQALLLNTYLSLNYYVKRLGYKNITVNGTKRETIHLFRHNYAKQLYLHGDKPAEVGDKMKITTATANIYINSVIEQPD